MNLTERRDDRTVKGREGEPGSEPRVSAVVVNWNTRDVLLECLGSLVAVQEDLPIEIVVVDNASADGSADAVRDAFPEVQLLASRRNSGFGTANNRAFRHCRGQYLLLVNPDVRVTAEAVRGLVEFMDERDDAGAAGVQLVYPDERLQNSYDNFPTPLTELVSKHLLRLLFPARFPSKRKLVTEPMPVDVIIGAFLILRAEIVEELGGFDENYFLFVEETDLCRCIRDSGRKIYHVPNLRVYHGFHHSQARAPALAALESARSTYYYFKKHDKHLAGVASDLFYIAMTLKLLLINMPLSLIATIFTLGKVPRHVRRLRTRALLTLWHLCGCPRPWGLRRVSSLRGFQRQREGGLFANSLTVVPDWANDALRRFLRDPKKAIDSGEVTTVEKCAPGGRGVEVTTVSFQGPIVDQGFGAETSPEGEQPRLVLRAYRERFLSRLRGPWRVPRGILDFEEALNTDDISGVGNLVVGAGVVRCLGIESYSYVALLEGDLTDNSVPTGLRVPNTTPGFRESP